MSTEQLANLPGNSNSVSSTPTEEIPLQNRTTRPSKRQLRFERHQAKLRAKRKEERIKKRSSRKRRLDEASAALLSTTADCIYFFWYFFRKCIGLRIT